MDDVLVDTSVWIDFFRNSEGVAELWEKVKVR